MKVRGLTAGVVVCFALLFLIGCAAGPNAVEGTAASDGSTAGFWLGLWHGIISPFTFLASLFSDKVNLYEVHNSGGWYNFGFIMGVVIMFRGSAEV